MKGRYTGREVTKVVMMQVLWSRNSIANSIIHDSVLVLLIPQNEVQNPFLDIAVPWCFYRFSICHMHVYGHKCQKMD